MDGSEELCSVDQLWSDDFHVAGLALLDDFHGFGGVEEAVYATGAGLLEVLVVLPVVLGFLQPVLTQLCVAGDVLHALVIGEHSNDLVVDFAAVVEFHDANDAGLHQGAGHQGLRHTDDLDVEGVAVLIPGAGNGAVGEGIGQGGIADAIELEVTGFGDQLVLINRVAVELHDGVQPQLGFIGKCRQHVKQVEHRAAWGVIYVRHQGSGPKDGRHPTECQEPTLWRGRVGLESFRVRVFVCLFWLPLGFKGLYSGPGLLR